MKFLEAPTWYNGDVENKSLEATVGSEQDVAIGLDGYSEGGSVAIGSNSIATKSGISIGSGNVVNPFGDKGAKGSSIAIGEVGIIESFGTICIGHDVANELSTPSSPVVHIGDSIYGSSELAIGNSINLGSDGIAVGVGLSGGDDFSSSPAVMVGRNIEAGSDSVVTRDIAIGENIVMNGSNAVVIGVNAVADVNAIAIGNGAKTANGGNCVVIGSDSDGGASSIAIGYDASAVRDAVAIGYGASAVRDAVAIGKNAMAASNSEIRIGNNNAEYNVYFGKDKVYFRHDKVTLTISDGEGERDPFEEGCYSAFLKKPLSGGEFIYESLGTIYYDPTGQGNGPVISYNRSGSAGGPFLCYIAWYLKETEGESDKTHFVFFSAESQVTMHDVQGTLLLTKIF